MEGLIVFGVVAVVAVVLVLCGFAALHSWGPQ